jgi:hypothetical protein
MLTGSTTCESAEMIGLSISSAFMGTSPALQDSTRSLRDATNLI